MNWKLGVRLPHSIILNRLQWQFETFPYSNTEKVGVFKTALTFVDSVAELWGPLINGTNLFNSIIFQIYLICFLL